MTRSSSSVASGPGRGDANVRPTPRPRLALLVLALLASLVGCGSAVAVTEERPSLLTRAEGGCGSLGDIPLGTRPTDLLDGRLSMLAPDGATTPASAHGVVAAPEPARSQSRVLVRRGGGALMVVATELFRRPGPDLAGAVRAWLGEDDQVAVGQLALPGGLRAVTVARREWGADDAAGPALRVVVARADDTVQHVGFFLNGAAAADAEGCGALLRRMAETLRPGPRALEPPGTRELVHGLLIDVPPDYALLVQQGPDFDVFRIYRLVVLGGPHAELGVYVGAHPSSHAQAADVREVRGALLGQSVPWLVWSTSARPGDPTLHHAEALEPLPGESGSWVHVFAVAEDPAILDELVSIVATLRLGEGAP